LAASAAVWFRLIAVAPAAPLTGAVATSPSLNLATWPFANVAAGATAALVPVVALALADALADAVGVAPNADWLTWLLLG
jgi:hypothetical protein